MKRSSKKIKHAVILVNYQTAEDTIACIKSIRGAKDAPHIIVVDNGSRGEVVTKLRTEFPGLDIIALTSNLGYCAGNNLGISKALKMGAQVVYLLNNDTEVDKNLFFRSYRYVAGKNRISGAKIYYAKGYEYHEAQKGQGNVLWYAGGYFDWTSVIARHYGVDEQDVGTYNKVKQVDFVTGCFMAIPKQVIKKIGYLDESLFLYLEDAEYSLRAKAAGIEVMYNPNLVLYHKNSSSTVVGSPLVDYYLTRNRFIIGKRYGSLRLRLALLREGLLRNFGLPIRRAALLDYLLGRLGNRNDHIEKIKQKMAV